MSRWDLFCRVVDNYGDIGVCWRLARQLASEYALPVRLWVDDLVSFARLCPAVDPLAPVQVVESVEVRSWTEPFPVVDPEEEIAAVVIEAFACELPAESIAAMTRAKPAPVWINLEYLSAEEWVEGCHLGRSPQPEPGLVKTFFFPGFTARTGGLLKERHLLDRRARFDARAEAAFRSQLGVPPRTDGVLTVSLFCYENSRLMPWLDAWRQSEQPVQVLVSPGWGQAEASRWLGEPFPEGALARRGAVMLYALPFLPQREYDPLLWSCDLNFVRGEDSFVRAQWAQRPFVWQAYPQAEAAHVVKLNAFLDRYLVGDGADETTASVETMRAIWQDWNGLKPLQSVGTRWAELVRSHRELVKQAKEWAARLDQAGDLANNLVRFVGEQGGLFPQPRQGG
jgi:uncharacterized repeat protein (TIGR03837 family)